MSRIIVLSTCATIKNARRIGRELVERRLAACVNILPVSSYYQWKGKLVDDHEYLMIIKTRSEVFAKVTQSIRALHSYELPEIICFKILDGFKPYLAWIDRQVRFRK